MEHFSAPRNAGTMEAPDRIGRAGTPGQGPFMVVFLKLSEDRVAQTRYQTFGCGASIAAGSLLTEMISGLTVAECLEMTVDQLSDAMGGFPADKQHCPILAVAALHDALKSHVAAPKEV